MTVRSLLVAQMPVWPVRRGAQIRLEQVATALAERGTIDLVTVLARPHVGPTDPPPAAFPIRRTHEWVVPADPSWGPGDRARWIFQSSPIEHWQRRHTATGGDLAARLADTYDLIWVSRGLTYLLTEPALRGRSARTVIDLDDLDGQKQIQRAALDRSRGRHYRRFQAGLNAHRWTRQYRRIATPSTPLVVCSEEDRAAMGIPHVHVVPNTFRGEPGCTTADAARRQAVAGKPEQVLLLQGSLTYSANIDAARWFVRHVLPLVSAVHPGVQLRLVGEPAAEVRALHDPPRVEVTGFVDDLDSELRRATMVVVPIRFEGGTRIKILEAFAHGVPVVSTSAGAHGLGTRAGTEVQIGDDPEGFADQVCRLLLDPERRGDLAAAGWQLLDDRFSPGAQRAALDRVIDGQASNHGIG